MDRIRRFGRITERGVRRRSMSIVWQSKRLLATNLPFVAETMITNSPTLFDGEALMVNLQEHESVQQELKIAASRLHTQYAANPQFLVISATLIDTSGQPIHKSAKRPDNPVQRRGKE